MDKSLKGLLRIPRQSAMYYVAARQKTFMHTTEIYIPDNPYEKIKEGYELSSKISTSAQQRIESDSRKEEDIERSVRRAKTAIKDIVLSNQFELFATFTFASNREDQENTKEQMSGWLKREKKKSKNFKYLIVPELHKDGAAIHFHALISGYTGPMDRSLSSKSGKPLVKKGRRVYNFPSFTHGYTYVNYIGDTESDQFKTSFYLLKYVRKDILTFFNKRRYWHSRNLRKPYVIENPQRWFQMYVPDKTIKTPYGTYLYYDNKQIKEHLRGNIK